MRVLSKLIKIDLGKIENLRQDLEQNKLLKVIERSENIIEVHPNYKSSLPFTSKSKSSLNYHYKFSFNDEGLKVDYILRKQLYFSLIFEMLLIPILILILFFYPKILVILLIFILALIFSLITTFISLQKAKFFLKKEILKNGSYRI